MESGEGGVFSTTDETLSAGGADIAVSIIGKRRDKTTPYRSLDMADVTAWERKQVDLFKALDQQLSDRSEGGLIPQSLINVKPHYELFARAYQKVIQDITPEDLAEGFVQTRSSFAKKPDGTRIGVGLVYNREGGEDGKLVSLNLRIPAAHFTRLVEYRFSTEDKGLEANIVRDDPKAHLYDVEPVKKEDAISSLEDYLLEPKRWGTVL